MSSSLLDSLTSLASPSMVSSVATKLGEPEQAVSKGMTSGFASILAGLVSKVGDGGGFRQIFDMISNNNPATAAIDNPANLANMVGTGGSLANVGQQFLSAALPGNVGSVSNLIASHTGLRPDSASSVLSMAAPMVLGVLGKRVASGGMNAAGLGNLLMAEKDSILRAAPAGVGNLFGLPDMARAAAGSAAGGAQRVASAATTHSNPSGRRWPWLILLLAILALLWGWCRKRTPETNMPAAVDTTLTHGKNAMETAMTKTGAAVAGLGAMVSRNLPGGAALNVPENGIESKLIVFIEDKNRPVSDTVWFNFDRILFQTNSAQLEPQSQEQIKNIGDIMKAYPNVSVKIGGYTDNTGDPAANLKLSKERAESVRKALQDQGIAPARLASEGYGDKYPVADNNTEEGRAQNRRIALRVTKK